MFLHQLPIGKAKAQAPEDFLTVGHVRDMENPGWTWQQILTAKVYLQQVSKEYLLVSNQCNHCNETPIIPLLLSSAFHFCCLFHDISVDYSPMGSFKQHRFGDEFASRPQVRALQDCDMIHANPIGHRP